MTLLGRVAEAAVTPLVPSDVLDLFSPLRAGADLRGRVVEVRRETADAATLVIRPGRDWAGHRPGQYVRIGVDVDGVRLWRAYSLTSRVGTRDISITVKAMPEGEVSNFLVRRARAGLLVHLDQATGDFVLPDALPTKLLFVTGGSGITPVMGMIRNLATVSRPDITLVHTARSRDEVIFGAELRALTGVRVVENHDDTNGFLTLDRIRELVPDLAERRVYACGPAGLLELLEAELPDLTTERFRASVVEPGEGGTVAFTSGTTLEADGATPILDAAEDAGVLMPSGCRMGICFGCVLPLREGAVRDLRTGEITTAVPGETDPAGIPIQTCISAAAGACHIDH